MFKELIPLLRKGDTLGLSIALEDAGQVRVNIIPRLVTLDGEKGTDRLALNQPLTLTGTAEELDSAEFTATLTRYTASTNATRNTIDEVEAIHKTAAATKKSQPAPEKPGLARVKGKSGAKAIADKPKAEKPAPAPKPTAVSATPVLI